MIEKNHINYYKIDFSYLNCVKGIMGVETWVLFGV